jgi:chromosome partitioning protein
VFHVEPPTVLASPPTSGQDASVTDPTDDLASRGRAIFRRLRGDEASEAGEESGAAPEEPPFLSEEDLAAFSSPPPPERVDPASGPLPGADDLPDAEDGPEDPIFVPPEEEVDAVVPTEVPSSVVRPLPRVLAIANQKGGVGKTTTAVNLGACLADLGYRVLVVDLDPQGNASTGLGINIRDLHGSMYDVVLHDLPIEDCVEATSVRNLFCAPSSLDLAGAEIELVPAFSRELRLKRALDEVRDDYDFVLIDCPPSLGLLTVNGLAAASEVVVPIQCEYYALEGLGQLLRNVNLVQKNLNPTLEVSAIVLVMYDARTKLADQVVTEVRAHFGPMVCKNVVPRTVRLSEAPSFGQPIIAFDPSSRGAIAYRELAKEVSGGTPQRAG